MKSVIDDTNLCKSSNPLENIESPRFNPRENIKELVTPNIKLCVKTSRRHRFLVVAPASNI